MAQVTLPLGWPLLSGQQFDLLVYQGNVVRLYDVPNDPRTSEQMFQRKQFSDLAKMRATIGAYPKGACRAVFGSKWWTVVYQLSKLDHGDWWTDAEAEWAGFSSGDQLTWRTAAPYQATFNDPGKIYFVLLRVIYHALLEYSGLTWGAQEWASDAGASSLEWWQSDLEGPIGKGSYDDRSLSFARIGDWSLGNAQNCIAGTFSVKLTNEVGEFRFFFLGRVVHYYHSKGETHNNVSMWLDGTSEQVIDYYAGYEVWQVDEVVDFGYKGLHHFRLACVQANYIDVDAITIDQEI